jgi:hypothetical protein
MQTINASSIHIHIVARKSLSTTSVQASIVFLRVRIPGGNMGHFQSGFFADGCHSTRVESYCNDQRRNFLFPLYHGMPITVFQTSVVAVDYYCSLVIGNISQFAMENILWEVRRLRNLETCIISSGNLGNL